MGELAIRMYESLLSIEEGVWMLGVWFALLLVFELVKVWFLYRIWKSYQPVKVVMGDLIDERPWRFPDRALMAEKRILLLLLCLASLTACADAKGNPYGSRAWKDTLAQEIVNDISYVRDSKGLCYAVAQAGQHGAVMTLVPSENCPEVLVCQ